MSGEESQELETSIERLVRVCRIIKNISITCFVVFMPSLAIVLGLMLLDLVNSMNVVATLKSLLYVLSYGFVIGALLLISIKIFSNIVSGESPFTIKQAKRFRIAGALLLLLAVVESILSMDFSYSVQLSGVNFAANGSTGAEQSVINIDAMMIFFAVILFSLSVLFQYGILLQRLCDETV